MKWIFIFALLVLTSCTTTGPVPQKSTMPAPDPVQTPAPRTNDAPAIDFEALKSYLKMDRDRDNLGFREKAFNTCDVGSGYSRNQNCQQQKLTVIHFRLMCRDSEGTISQVLTDADLQALGGRTVRWNLKGSQGTTRTDNEGYGQIITATPWSQRTERMRLTLGNEFLMIRAGDAQKLVTPRPWCDQY